MSWFEKSIYVFLISILPIVELRGAIPVGAALGLPFYLYAPLSVLGNLLPIPFILLFIPKILDLLERVRLFRPIIRWVREKANRGLVRIKKRDVAVAKEQTQIATEVPPEGNTVGVSEATREGGQSTSEFTARAQENAGGLDARAQEQTPVHILCTEETSADEAMVAESVSPAVSNGVQATTEGGSVKKTLSLGAFVGLLFFVMIPLPGTGAWTGALVASLFDFPKGKSALAITLGVLGACVIMTLASEGVVSIFKLFL